MGGRPKPNLRSRARALVLGAVTTLALIAGLTPAAVADASPGEIDVYVTFEGYNLGQGYYIEPVKVTVPEGTTAAEVSESVLDDAGHDYGDPGDPTSGGWYLSKVAGFDTGAVNVPAYNTSQPDFELGTENGDAYLGEFDYFWMSGWMYTVNNAMADVGAGANELTDGDVMRWQFSLQGYGCDLGVADGCRSADAAYFVMADKGELIRAIVDADPSTATADELTSARAVAIDPLATPAQVTTAIDALEQPESSAPWITITTTASGQVLAKIQEQLVSEFGQSAESFDYTVVERLRVVGPINSNDIAAVRNSAYAGLSITHLDLSAATTTSMSALNGMTALADVQLPAVASLTTSNLFNGNAALKNVTVAAATTSFGSSSTFTGATGLERITFQRASAPTTFNASTFNGSNNADPQARVVVAAVPDRTSGGYQAHGFTQYFANVVDIGPNPPASAEERAGLRSVIDEAGEITRIGVITDAKWQMLQDAKAAAQNVLDAPASTGGAVADALSALRSAIDGLLGLSFKVTKGATVGLHQKGSLHFAAFTRFDLTKVEELSDTEYDVYVPATTLANGTYNLTGLIRGETDKVARIFTVNAASANNRYTVDLTPLNERQQTPILIPGFNAGDSRGLYTNLDDTGAVELGVGETFDLDTFRTVQGQGDQVSNYFIEPDFRYEVVGDSITTERTGSEGRRRLAITATQPGVSVVKISYDPLKHIAANGTVTDFNGIEEQNTGVVVVKVGGEQGTFATGLDVRNDLDTFYFDKSVGSRDLSFTPAAGTTVRVHDPLNVSDWGSGWTGYQADADGEFTVRLRGGRNIIELTNDGAVQYQVVRAKGIDVTIANATDPGQRFEAGDLARLSLVGVESGIQKLAGIYNPGWGALPKLTYSDGTTPITSNTGGQYTSVTSTYTLNYPVTDAEATLDGYLTIGGMGAEWPYHREIPLGGKPPNLNAAPIGPYNLGALPTIHVYDGQVSTRPKAVLTTSVTATAPPIDYGRPGRVAVTVAAEGRLPTGVVDAVIGGTTVIATLSDGQATLPIPARALEPGSTTISVRYRGVEGEFEAASAEVAVRVAKASSTVKVSGTKSVKRGKTATYTVRVHAAGVKATGKVTLKVAGRTKTVTLNGAGVAKVKVRIAKTTKPARKTVTVRYLGNAHLTTAKATTRLRVLR